MKKLGLLIPLVFIFIIAGCTTTRNYLFTMVEPALSKNCRYENETLEIEFKTITNQLTFNVRNKTNEPLKIIWDNCVFTGLDNVPTRVIHWGIKYIDREKTMAPTIIPPYAAVSEGVIPSKNIRWTGSNWIVYYVIPGNINARGQHFSLYLCYETSGQQKYENFTFVLSDVETSHIETNQESHKLCSPLPNGDVKYGVFLNN